MASHAEGNPITHDDVRPSLPLSPRLDPHGPRAPLTPSPPRSQVWKKLGLVVETAKAVWSDA